MLLEKAKNLFFEIFRYAQYDNIEVFAMPCNPLGSLFVKGSK